MKARAARRRYTCLAHEKKCRRRHSMREMPVVRHNGAPKAHGARRIRHRRFFVHKHRALLAIVIIVVGACPRRPDRYRGREAWRRILESSIKLNKESLHFASFLPARKFRLSVND